MATTTAATSSSQRYGRGFWERLWRTAGIQSVGLLLVAWFLYGPLPGSGDSAGTIGTFAGADHTRTLIATSLLGLALLNLMWFAAALMTTLAEAGQDGWGAAATAASSAIAGLFLMLGAIVASLVLSGSAGGTGSVAVAANNLVWAGFVLTSFPRAMLIMAGSLGLWRAGLISNGVFAAGVACILLTLLGGTTWLAGGLWAPDGVYSRIVSPVIGLLWVLAASAILLKSPPAKIGW